MASRRPLHFVFRVANRETVGTFFIDILGMKALRHEEFEEIGKATCNGPDDGKWSKTKFGYDRGDNHFQCVLIYTYGFSHHEMDNDFLGMYIESSEAIDRAKANSWPVKQVGKHSVLVAPGGYQFFIANKPQPQDRDPVQKIVLASSNLERSVNYWRDLAGLTMYKKTDKAATFGFGDTQAKVVLQDIGEPVNRTKASGCIAFAAPIADLLGIEKKVKEADQAIISPSISLILGKVSVQVLILADPDGHEICFVGMSQVNPEVNEQLNEGIDEWFA